ncbi:DUF882 domain-containing protein [Ancylobacter dichloromethanicus]|uniref:DUF882 domain-containing protein n=1 Tax=Ancylobacter dichloromethanicus TaxID=518825 RepID=UPI001BD072D1|nr:DUF882 domain-containing protein [Ancylobacter dichloromethanicus]MBS7555250.1 DUF882 domain-containing protein [Ancylobacter dichloromethanicus]
MRITAALRSSRLARAAAIAAVATLCGADLLQDAVANGDTRTLTFHHVHSGATATITFKRNGRYDPAALKQLDVLMQDWRRKESTKMDPRLFDIVWEVYREVDATQPIQVIGGYRSPATNAMLRSRSRGVAQTSLHMQGRAMDFYIPGVPLAKIREAGLRLQRGGVGFYPTSGSPFVHLDTGGIRHWPRMSRPELARVFPNGKTVHVPADGKPMPGYALALAEVEARGKEPGGAGAAFAGLSGGNDPKRKGGANGGTAGAPAKNIFASLFGKDGDDEEEATPAVAAAPPAAATPSATTQLALAGPVPSPMPRPALPAGPATPAGAIEEVAPFEVASIGPVPLPQPNPLPRTAVAVAAAAPVPRPAAPGASASDKGDLAALAAAIPLPGTPEAATDRQIATALSVAPVRAGESGGLPEVIVRGTGGAGPALAYADAAGSLFSAPRLQPGRAPEPEAAPARASRPAPSQAAQARKPQPYSPDMVAQIRRLFAGPSVARNVSMHLPELRRFAAFVLPPRRIVAARFRREGAGGLSTTQFSGEAVVAVPVVAMMTGPAPLKKPL